MGCLQKSSIQVALQDLDGKRGHGGTDNMHMNDEYGELYLNHLLQQIRLFNMGTSLSDLGIKGKYFVFQCKDQAQHL